MDMNILLDTQNPSGKTATYGQYLVMNENYTVDAATAKAPLYTVSYFLQSYLDNVDNNSKYIEVAANFPGFGYIGAILEVLTKPAVTA